MGVLGNMKPWQFFLALAVGGLVTWIANKLGVPPQELIAKVYAAFQGAQ